MEGRKKCRVWGCEKSQDGFEGSCQPHPRFPHLFNKVLDLGKSCSCQKEQIDVHSNKQLTQHRQKLYCSLGTALNVVRDQDLGAAPVPPVPYLLHTPH